MDCTYFKIEPMYEKEEFIRSVWISLAKEDVPLSVFDSELSEVTQEQYRILSASAVYETHWQGEIGRDRSESYIDFETYYEQIPYTVYERKHNYSTGKNEEKPVTKYRKEERQRQVTKQRTVTDWSFESGKHYGSADCFSCVDYSKECSEYRLNKDFQWHDCKSMSESDIKKEPDMNLTENMLDFAQSKHEEKIEEQLYVELPGDHVKNISYQIDNYLITDISLVKVPEYQTTITYNGETFVKKGFAFGNMMISKAKISNPTSIESGKEELKKKRDQEIEERKLKSYRLMDKRPLPFKIISWVLLLASIAGSALLKIVTPIVILFAAAIVSAVFAKIYEKIVCAIIRKNTEIENSITEDLCEEACRDYEKTRRMEMLDVLNKKLASLGLKPATESELLNKGE